MSADDFRLFEKLCTIVIDGFILQGEISESRVHWVSQLKLRELDAYQNACEADEFDMLLLKLVREYPLNSRECEECDKDIECAKACPQYTLKHLPEIIRFFLNEGWNHRKYGIGLLSMLLYTTDGKVILEIAKMILEIGVDGTDEDFDRLLGYIAEAESHARCSWVDCETNADDLAECYDLVLRVNRGDIFG